MNESDFVYALHLLVNGSMNSDVRCTPEEAETFFRANTSWRDAEAVQGLGVGMRSSEGSTTRELTLKVYVDAKLNKSRVRNAAPSTLTVPGLNQAVPVDVDEIGELGAQAFTGHVRPAKGGMQITHPKGSPGTLGCVVSRRGTYGDRYILSNRHVLAPLGLASKYDFIQQPAIAASGSLRVNAIASLDMWSRFQNRHLNRYDAAIAKVIPGKVQAEVRELGAPKGVRHDLQTGMRIMICGASSGVNMGTIVDRFFCTNVRYRNKQTGMVTAGFHGQVLCTGYSAPGDSGALVMDEAKLAVGLHFAGTRTYSVFSPIQPILDDWGLELASPTDDSVVDHGLVASATPDATVDILARTLWGEAEGEGKEGQAAVAAVILNRTKRPRRFAPTIEKVCKARLQFSCWNEGPRKRALLAVDSADTNFRHCIEIAERAIAGTLADPTNGADHYHARSILPGWASAHAPCAIIGNHIFYNSIP